MNYLRKGHVSLALALAASAIPLTYDDIVQAPAKPEPPREKSERLTKAEKKRARKAAQRLKLVAREKS